MVESGPADPEAEPKDELTITRELLTIALQERDEYKDQLLRALADLQNSRRRAMQERDDLRRYATEELVRNLIPVLDNFERALNISAESTSLSTLIEGLKAIDRQFRAVLEGANVSRIESLGQPFDPEHHEAIATLVSDEHDEGTVVEEVEAGYRIGERVVRPARVRVSKRP